MASTYLIRSTPSETFNKLTVSCWFKGMADGTQRNFWGLYDNTDNNRFFGLYYSSNGSLYAYWKQDGSLQFTLGTMQKFRDPNAWYHFVMTMDTTLATASDRVKFYLNGERITVFEDSLDTITQNKNVDLMNGTTDGRMQWGGGKISGTQYYWNGSMSHCHMCVGYAYDASSFGSTDATTGEWKINTSPSVSYGTNGGFWLKDGNQLTDSSTNSNTLTVGGGTITKTEDNPSNVFATINPLFVNDDGDVNALTKGNNTYTSAHTNEWHNMASTLGAVTGKYYWEVKYEQLIDTSTIYMASEGVASTDFAPANLNIGEGSRSGYGYGWLCGNRNTTSNTRYLKTVNGTATLTTDSNNTPVVAGDIVGVAGDATNGKLWFHKNGTYIDDTSGYVGNPSSDAYPYHTGMQTGILYTVWSDVWQNSTGSDLIKSYNFGNGYFGTTAVSSAGTNASGIGIFEYDVPTGYTALSTKGLNL